MILDYVWKLHLSSSYSGKTKHVYVTGMLAPYLTPIYGRTQADTHTTLWVYCKNVGLMIKWNVEGDRKLSGQWTGFYPVHFIEQDSTLRIHVVGRRGEWRRFMQRRGPRTCGQKFCHACERNFSKRKTALGERKAEGQLYTRADGYLFYRSGRQGIQWNIDKCTKGVGSAHGLCSTVQIAKDLREFIYPSKRVRTHTRKFVMHTGKERSFAITAKKGITVHACKCEAHELTRKRIPETQNKDHEITLPRGGWCPPEINVADRHCPCASWRERRPITSSDDTPAVGQIPKGTPCKASGRKWTWVPSFDLGKSFFWHTSHVFKCSRVVPSFFFCTRTLCRSTSWYLVHHNLHFMHLSWRVSL